MGSFLVVQLNASQLAFILLCIVPVDSHKHQDPTTIVVPQLSKQSSGYKLA
jgi:hypothetical protein